jgi:hypothetical protein
VVAVQEKGCFSKQLERCKDLPDIFELVKEAVRQCTGWQRAGLMLGLADLGGGPQGFIGAYYPVASNIIVMNRLPLRRIEQTEHSLYKPYAFHILLHEYLHALGMLDENTTRAKVHEISSALFGDEHVVTNIASDLSSFVPKLMYPDQEWSPPEDAGLQLIKGFDRSSTDPYIY